MKFGKLSAGVLAAVLASGALAPVLAQDAPPTRESTHALLSKVSEQVWSSRLSSAHNAQMLEAYRAGEADYFKGDYEKATKKLKAAEAMTSNSPNNVGGAD